MENNFKSVSLTYRTAPVEVRGMMAVDESQSKKLMLGIKEFTDATELLVLSTCNRTEIYYYSPNDCSKEIIKLLGIQKGISNISDYFQYFTIINNHQEAIQHLFDVSIGLDAQVIGDMQISNQVKTAYQWSADLGVAGPFLHRLMHTIFFTNKKVVQQTAFRDGAASVSYATVELAEELASEIINPKVLIIGLGEMGADVCRNMLSTDLKDITVANRTRSKAEELAKGTEIKVIDFENIWEAIKEADVIITSVSKEEPIITKEKVKELNILSYKYFIDLSVPRNVEAKVEEVPGVLVYNIDNIQNRATEALEKRIKAIPLVKEIIAESIAEFSDWSKEMAISPTINKLKNALEQIRQEELARYMKHLTDEECKKMEQITRNMMQKVMKLPVLQLKAACKRGEAETLIDVLNDLFDLEKQPAELKENK
ncbi:MAG TPA: glutamyl-tRNA reductase [Cytophagaceae bacterium]